ncbi:hypothetical protein PMAYCL1PPCAC_22068, partial [Pristionchus mayeri]
CADHINTRCPNCQSVSLDTRRKNIVFDAILDPPEDRYEWKEQVLTHRREYLKSTTKKHKQRFEDSKDELSFLQSPYTHYAFRTINAVNYPIQSLCEVMYGITLIKKYIN